MIKTILYITFLVLMVFFIADTKVSFKPFKVTFERGWFAAGLIFLGIGVAFIQHQSHRAGYKVGLKDGVDYTIERLENMLNKEQSAQESDTTKPNSSNAVK